MTACLLALDTSTDLLAVALVMPGVPGVSSNRIVGLNEAGGAQASSRLIPALMALLADNGLALRDLQAIAFGQGPGAFTGLRTACAVAQGLALAHETPLLPIDSLMIVAEDARCQQAETGSPPQHQDWWVAMDARMDEVYAAHYNHGPTGWTVRVAPQLWTLPALVAAWAENPPQQIAGSALSAFDGRLPWGGALCVPDCLDRAGALGRLAAWAWQQGAGIAPDEALPLYLRDKVALTTAERSLRKATPLAGAT
jgi:tRNA threonylcarbamoyladenosine biosynthesis protein TsaB